MILACSSCHARYLVPDGTIGANGRTVRCGRCAHQWFCPAPPPSSAPDIDRLMREGTLIEPVPQQPTPLPEGSNLPVRRPQTPLRMLALALALTLTAAVAAVAAFMPSFIGVPPTTGLAFTDVAITPVESGHAPDSMKRYTLTGRIVNNAQETLPSPTVRLTLLDGSGRAVRRWWLPQHQMPLAPGASTPFSLSELDAPNDQPLKLRLDLGNWLELAVRPVP